MQHYNIVDNFEKRETAIRSKLRNLMREGIARPVKRIRQGIFDLLKLHPLPRYCGPFTGQIDGHWNYNYFYRLSEEYSNDADKHFIYLALLFILLLNHVENGLLMQIKQTIK